MKRYYHVFLMGMEQALEYRLSFFLSMLSAAFPILIQTTMWNYLYGNADAAVIFGYKKGEILLYALLATIVSQLVVTGFEGEMNIDIKMGGLNKYLIRPIDYKNYQFFRFLGQKIPRAMVVLPVMAVIVGLGIRFDLDFSAGRTGAYLLSLFFALILNFSIFFCIGLLGFWLTEVEKLFGTISIVFIVASGGVFPLDIFGETATMLVRVLPFGYTTQFSVNIINGRYRWEDIGIGFAVQIGWTLFFTLLGRWMWNKGTKHYAAVGG